MKYLVANWKAHKRVEEGISWAREFSNLLKASPKSDVKIIVCPPYPLLYPIKKELGGINNLYLGAQDISSFDEGRYTGEVTGKSLKGIVDYVIVGHSERRSFFNETEEIIEKKVKMAQKYGIETILCVRNENDKIYEHVTTVAYEPPSSIGTGENEDANSVINMRGRLNLGPKVSFLYGGSVNSKDIGQYLKHPEIEGFLVGIASLNPSDFFNIVSAA